MRDGCIKKFRTTMVISNYMRKTICKKQSSPIWGRIYISYVYTEYSFSKSCVKNWYSIVKYLSISLKQLSSSVDVITSGINWFLYTHMTFLVKRLTSLLWSHIKYPTYDYFCTNDTYWLKISIVSFFKSLNDTNFIYHSSLF